MRQTLSKGAVPDIRIDRANKLSSHHKKSHETNEDTRKKARYRSNVVYDRKYNT